MKTLNRKKSISLCSLFVLGAFLLMSSYAYGSPDYYNYWTWNTGYNSAYGVDGWVDGGTDKIIFYSGTTAYIYQVTTTAGPDGDNPNLHPDNPDATGAIAPRVFTYDSQFALNSSNYGHDDAFYVGSDGFYLGTAWNGIEKYDFSGNYLATIAPAKTDDWVQGLAYDEASQSWWTAGGTSRNVWKYDMANTAAGWTYEFTYTPVAGSDHHDGLEVLSNGNLLFADYAGQIVEYQQDGTFVAQHLHDPFPTELESMGAGALGHYWGGSHSGWIFEFGGGSLPPLNQPPVADAGPDQTVEQESYDGTEVTLDGSGSTDPDSTPGTNDDIIGFEWYEITTYLGIGETINYTLPLGSHTVTLRVTDSFGGTDEDEVIITVVDTTPPVIVVATVEPQLVEVSGTVNFDGVVGDECDPNPTVEWDFGDAETSDEIDTTHAYAAPGIYNVTLTVTDSSGNASTEEFIVVVYDPSGGFVTGGGWIYSDPGAYVPDPTLEGKANFGFVSKYKKGAEVPTGNTEFQFHAGDLNFHSSSYEWLVVNQAGTNAQFKGAGTINDSGYYKFMLWAGDAPDTFRIRIWEEYEDGFEADIYDNGVDQAVGSGSIIVHTIGPTGKK